MLGAGALGRPRGMVWGGRREGCSGWGTHVYLWRIHFDIWQNQYNIVKLKNKIKLKKKEYWGGWPFPSPGDLPNPGIFNPGLLHCRQILYCLNHQGIYYFSPPIYFFFYFIFKLYKIVLVLPNIKMNPPQVYMCSAS